VTWVPGWSRWFSCNLNASSSDDCLGRWDSRITSFISDWSNKEAITNNFCWNYRQTCHHLLKLENIWVYHLLHDREGSWIQAWVHPQHVEQALKLKRSLDIGVSVYFSHWSLSHLPFRSKDLQRGLLVPSRSLECQKEGAYLFHGIVAIGNPEWHGRKASHRGSKQQ